MNLIKFLTGSTRSNSSKSFPETICTLHDPMKRPLEAVRTKFSNGATSVFAWPSYGGVFVHSRCYGVELDFLGLSRFEDAPTERDSDPEKEDAFCKRLQWIGARYFESNEAYWHSIFGMEQPEPAVPWLGWPGAVPEGGVWVLWSGYGNRRVQGAGRIQNAYTMEERCKAIEMLGGEFYQDWEEVEEPRYILQEDGRVTMLNRSRAT